MCGAAKTAANVLGTQVEWGSFLKTPLGSSVLTAVPLRVGSKTVSGTATRFAPGTSGNSTSGPDEDSSGVLHALGFLSPSQLGASAASGYAGAGSTTEPTSWYVSPSKTTLTYFGGSSAREIGWSIDSPKRTSASALPSDSFVRGIVGGTYFGIELVLSFPSECAVGALSDVLGRPALLRDAQPNSGIFMPGKTADVQAVLVANDVKMQVRVIGNKKIAAVETLLASTTCSPAKIAECDKLLTALNAAGQTFRASIGSSDVTKLQSDTDPGWSPIEASTAKISIAAP